MVSFVLGRRSLGLQGGSCLQKRGNGPQPAGVARRPAARLDRARQMQCRAPLRVGSLCEVWGFPNQSFDRRCVPSFDSDEQRSFRRLSHGGGSSARSSWHETCLDNITSSGGVSRWCADASEIRPAAAGGRGGWVSPDFSTKFEKCGLKRLDSVAIEKTSFATLTCG